MIYANAVKHCIIRHSAVQLWSMLCDLAAGIFFSRETAVSDRTVCIYGRRDSLLLSGSEYGHVVLYYNF